ncbi:MAG: SMR family transporter [Desulfovibrionaceae bacterium]
MNGYVYLGVAIASEVAATSALRAANGYTNLWPSLVVIGGYLLAFIMLGHVVKTVPVGVAYAIWSGLGIVGTAVIAFFLYGQKLDMPAVLGMGLILAGALVIQLFSKSCA